MRIIHTGDWHIGQMLGGYGREHEHRAVLDQLVGIVEAREIDAVIVAGDVFDSQNASGESQALFYETLVRLRQVRPLLSIVVIAGNHDAAGRLEAPRPLLATIGTRVVGNIRRRDGRFDAAHHLVGLPNRRGETAAQVLALSYPTAACLPPLAQFDGDVALATAALYAEAMAASASLRQGLPLIVTGHLHVAGGLESEGSERRILVGGQHALPPSAFPDEAAYVALGHLHRAQSIGRPSIRYCGSLIPLSAAEQSYAHGVTLLDLDATPLVPEHIPLARPVPFLRLGAGREVRLDDLGDQLHALDLDASLPIERWPFLHLRLARAGLPTGYRAEVDRILEEFAVRAVDIKVSAARDDPSQPGETDTFTRLSDLQPEDIFRRAFEKVHEAPPERAHVDIFHRVRAEV